MGIIIGLTGSKASGKGTVADYLKKKGFEYSSTSDRVREEAVRRGIEDYKIKDLQDIGNELRAKYGKGILMKRTLNKIKNKGKCVIDGIRNIGEIKELKKNPDSIILGIDAPQKERFERLLERDRDSDPDNWEDFLEMESRDLGENENESGQQVKKCLSMADHNIYNDGSLKKLYEKIDSFLSSINYSSSKKREDYISWDEYFMGVALLSAERSKDPSTQVGACVVNSENKIVGTGYNGFPIGCSDDNLPWGREGDLLNTKYPYVCHAELNAILNSTNDLSGCRIYVALFPCNECCKAIIQSGIREVIYLSDKYSDTEQVKASKKMFNQAGIKLRQLKPDREKLEISFSIE